MTRAGSRPSAAWGAWARASSADQPNAARFASLGGTVAVIGRSAVSGFSTSADPLQLAGPLGVALGPAERPQPERDEERAHQDQRPDITDQGRHRRTVDEAPPAGVEHVGRRRAAG